MSYGLNQTVQRANGMHNEGTQMPPKEETISVLTSWNKPENFDKLLLWQESVQVYL